MVVIFMSSNWRMFKLKRADSYYFYRFLHCNPHKRAQPQIKFETYPDNGIDMNAHIEPLQTTEYFAKELSWLSFNERVLQEAKDKNNPIIERMRFLGIFSNNLDEFFRVRVADVKRRILLNKLPDANFEEDEILLSEIQKKVLQLGKKFNHIHQQVLTDLNHHNIHVSRPDELSEFHLNWLKNYFHDHVLQHTSKREQRLLYLYKRHHDLLICRNE